MNTYRPAALIALGIAAACLTATGKCYEFAMDGRPESEDVFAVTTDAAVIAEVEKDLKVPIAQRRMITGPIATGNGGVNGKWTWHFVPDQWTLAEMSIELCDGSPSYVEAHRDEWIRDVKRYCPWSSGVLRECAASGIGAGPGGNGAQAESGGSIGFQGSMGADGFLTLALVIPSAGHATVKAFRPDGSFASSLDLGRMAAGARQLPWSFRELGAGLYRLVLFVDGRSIAGNTMVLP